MPDPIPANRSVGRPHTQGARPQPRHGPVPEPYRRAVNRPEPRRLNREARSFRRHSAAALAAVIASVVTWVYGATAYTGGRDVVGDGVRALVGIVVFIVAAVMVFTWFASLREWLSAQRRERTGRIE
jgi:hypothetical protein